MSVELFLSFSRQADLAAPVHRVDAGAEASAQLQTDIPAIVRMALAPGLAREQALERAQNLALTPKSPAPKGPGGMNLGGGPSAMNRGPQAPRKKRDDE